MAAGSSADWQHVGSDDIRLIRTFSEQAQNEDDASTVIQAVYELNQNEKEVEASKYRQYFNNTKVSSDFEISKLDVEAARLDAAIQVFQGESVDVGSSMSLHNLRSLVERKKTDWDGKSRWFNGKPQEIYHDVLEKLDAHRSLLSMLPSQEKYLSILTGAINTLASASREHRKTSQSIKSALIEINDEVAASMVDCELIRSEPMKLAIAKLYIAVFLFYADAIQWYRSSSKQKVRYSLHEKFSDKFKNQLENIRRLSGLVHRAASSGHGAQANVLLLEVDGVRQDLRAGLQGHDRHIAEEQHWRQIQAAEIEAARAQISLLQNSQAKFQEELWRRIGLQGTSMLQNEAQDFKELNNTEGAGRQRLALDKLPLEDTNTDDTPTPANLMDRTTFLDFSAQLCNYIRLGAPIPDLKPPPHLLAEQKTVVSLKDWMLSPESKLLCLEGPYAAPIDSEIALEAAYITWTAVDLNFPTISFFCEAESDTVKSNKAGSSGYLGLIYSLIHQLICLWPPTLDGVEDSWLNRLTSLNASELESWTPALELFRDLLQSAPPLLLCVIDGLQAFDETSNNQASGLIAAFRSGMEDKARVFKVLLTTSGYAPALLPLLKEGEYERFNVASAPGRAGPGKFPLQYIDDSLP